MALEWIFVNLGINVWLQGRVMLKTYAMNSWGKGLYDIGLGKRAWDWIAGINDLAPMFFWDTIKVKTVKNLNTSLKELAVHLNIDKI